MKQPSPPALDESLLAIAEHRANAWRVLLVRKGAPAAATSANATSATARSATVPSATILEAREFPREDSTGLSNWLRDAKCGDLRVMLPASSSIVRLSTIPNAAPNLMLVALRMQAEGMFLGSIPSSRLGLAFTGEATAEDRQGVIIAWPAAHVGVEVPAKLEAITRYIPEPAAMLVLASGELPALRADRRDGSIAIAMRCPSGFVLRATRETASEDDMVWSEGLRRSIAETALNAGIEPARVAAIVARTEAGAERVGDTVLMLDPAIRALLASQLSVQVEAAQRDGAWWREWAILLAAAIVATGPLSSLSTLARREKSQLPSRIERFVHHYSSPSRALRVALVAFLVLGVAPIIANWTRVQILEWKMPDEYGKFDRQQREIESRIALYSELSKRTVPVAKLLGDLACSTPDGIEIESIQISSTQGISVKAEAKAQGESSAAESVNRMAEYMDSSGVFEKTRWRWNLPDGRGIFKFDLDAAIINPTRDARIEADRDWSVKTLSQRKYGDPNADGAGTDEASGSAPAANSNARAEAASNSTRGGDNAAGSETDPEETGTADETLAATAVLATADGAATGSATGDATSDASASRPIASRGIGRREPTAPPTAPATADPNAPKTDAGSATPRSGAGSGSGAGGGPGGAAAANLVIPEPFTDEELKAMTKEQARARLGDLAKSKNRADLDAETRKRLGVDFNRILDYLKSKT